MVQVSNPPLAGARVLVVGVANADSIAWGCARAFHVGFATAYLATPYARRLSGNTVYVDGGVHIMT